MTRTCDHTDVRHRDPELCIEEFTDDQIIFRDNPLDRRNYFFSLQVVYGDLFERIVKEGRRNSHNKDIRLSDKGLQIRAEDQTGSFKFNGSKIIRVVLEFLN